MPRAPRRQCAIHQAQLHLRCHEARFDEIDFAAQQRRQCDFKVQFGDFYVGARIRRGELDIGKLQIRRRQDLEIDAATDFDRGTGEI